MGHLCFFLALALALNSFPVAESFRKKPQRAKVQETDSLAQEEVEEEPDQDKEAFMESESQLEGNIPNPLYKHCIAAHGDECWEASSLDIRLTGMCGFSYAGLPKYGTCKQNGFPCDGLTEDKPVLLWGMNFYGKPAFDGVCRMVTIWSKLTQQRDSCCTDKLLDREGKCACRCDDHSKKACTSRGIPIETDGDKFFALEHKSGKCVHPSGGSDNPGDKTKLVLYDGCDTTRDALLLHQDEGWKDGLFFLKHKSGKCVQPSRGCGDLIERQCEGPQNGEPLVFSSSCGYSMVQTMLLREVPGQDGYFILQHQNGKCVHASGGNDNPKNGVKLVFYDGCDPTDGALLFKQLVQKGWKEPTIEDKCAHSASECQPPDSNMGVFFSSECLKSEGIPLGCKALGKRCCRFCGFGDYDSVSCPS